MNDHFLTFWEHVDVLRKVIIKSLIAAGAVAVVAFFFKEPLFNIILAPHHPDFVTFQYINRLACLFSLDGPATGAYTVHLISTQLTAQFFIHVKIAFYAAVLCTFPYIVLQLFYFISPALYAKERKYAKFLVLCSILCFFMGVLLSYFVVFPFSFHFLADYSVSADIQNMFTINSYVDTLLMISLLLGILFEIPVAAWILAKMGLLQSAFLKKYRKHALIVILIVSAVITPTGDVFTLLLVSLPVLLLYQASIGIVSAEDRRRLRLTMNHS
jgi:sec-independent protein translocase protein TatC